MLRRANPQDLAMDRVLDRERDMHGGKLPGFWNRQHLTLTEHSIHVRHSSSQARGEKNHTKTHIVYT